MNYSISLLHSLTENRNPDAKSLNVLPLLAIEEESNKWYFKDCLGNRAATTKELIKSFVFGCERIKVFGCVYAYFVYYPENKPTSRELEGLRKKLL